MDTKTVPISGETLKKFKDLLLSLKDRSEEKEQEKGNVEQIAHLQQELESLKNALAESRQHAKQLDRVIVFLREKSEAARLENEQLQAELHAAQTTNPLKIEQKDDTVWKELSSIKQRLVQGLRTAKELEKRYLGAVKEKVASCVQVSQLKKENARLREQLSHFANQQTSGRENEKQILQKTLEEKEAEMVAIQQHFARKVREVAMLYQQIEELQEQVVEWTAAHSSINERNTELQTYLDHYAQEEELLKKQYEALEERHAMAERRMQELEQIESRYIQLQSLLSSLGQISSGPIQKAPPVFGFPPPEEKEENEEPESPPSRPYANLFDIPPLPSNPKPPSEQQ